MNAFQKRLGDDRGTTNPVHNFEADRPDLDFEQGTQFTYNPNVSLSLSQQRMRLPVFQVRNHILYLLEEKCRVLIVCGETGCGKSTQIPQYLLETGWGTNGIIGISEPRRIAATSLASRVADEVGCQLGSRVGYCIRFDDCTTAGVTKVKYLTEGILVCEMMRDPLLRQYSVLMIDEVHERTTETDLVLGLLRKIMKRRPDLRLIVSSATIDAEEMKDFFEEAGAEVISVEGRTHPVEIFYLENPTPDYIKAAAETVVNIHENQKLSGDILVFLTGMEEVDRCIQILQEYSQKAQQSKKKCMGGTLLPLPLYGTLSNTEQLKVFRPAPIGTRKVVVATNIAETSVTIPGIVYVVDSCFVKLKWFNSETRTDSLVVVPTSQASSEQRAGRAGRVKSGACFRLCTEESFNSLALATLPTIQRSDLSAYIVQLKALGVENILRFPTPSRPPAENVIAALESLNALGALDGEGALTKEIGYPMAEFPLEPVAAKFLLTACRPEFDCVEEALRILSMLQVQTVFLTPSSGAMALKVKKKRKVFEALEGDLVTLVNVYEAFIRMGKSRKWCQEQMVSHRGMMRAWEIKERMEQTLKKVLQGLPEGSVSLKTGSVNGDVEKLGKAITASYFMNVAYLHHSGVYKHIRSDQELTIHPTSVLCGEKLQPWLIYNEVVQTDKLYMRYLTTIQPEWLQEVASHYYEKRLDR
ncbi:unnamed protein product [Cyprideis torosa]|uniref:RNA helicase n=1 Tax=Cyprideis torosa TaxID=163714 RepID=A0A7R8WET1_9CRUS|nr:unnamed protein product [Cyprideis torosa]CAG0890150.1 unnamed protein product [Cyprideis torosa]